jgi:hypothetical protein
MRWVQTKILATAVAWAFATATTVDSDTQYVAEAAARAGCSLPDFWRFATTLSKQAEVYFPGSAGFTQYSQRWSNLEAPTVTITVLPATEQDVVEIVGFSLSFYRQV